MKKETSNKLVCVSMDIQAEQDMWGRVRLFILDFISSLEIDDSITHNILVACEEIYVNISQYAYIGKNGNVNITCGYYPIDKKLFVKFIDSGIKFDPTKKICSSIKKRLNECELGGLGIFIARNLSDSMEYSYIDNKNVLIITKCIK